uniref:Uncharacterized protein n=1 Tax=Anguilla anguilla TaxID=7936 RepID=A0A0E9T725_ANGAN
MGKLLNYYFQQVSL